ncbi:MAG: hypothetical protein KA801_02085 [Syntrophorhabdaceae bacterium]|nr:hypothetical protein [Syntrophorhabdaceae bacterium]
MANLLYPKKQTIAFSNALFRLYEFARATTDDDVVFDLSETKTFTPLGIILLTTTIKECLLRKKKCYYIEPTDKTLTAFLTKVGFHKHFNLDKYGAPPNFTIASGHVQLQRCEEIDGSLIEKLIEIVDYHLRISPGLKGSLQMSLLEMMTNVVDHSGVRDYYVCCHNYPEKKQIRLCMADMGMGIPTSLRKVYKGRKTDRELIVMATEEGITTRPNKGGLGLAHIKKFLKVNKGQLCIISGSGKVFWKFDQGKVLAQNMKTTYKGTIVKMVINTDKEAFYFLSTENDYLF